MSEIFFENIKIKNNIVYFLKIGQDHIMGWQVDSFKEETRFMVMELTEGLQIEICHVLSLLHQHIKKSIRLDEK